jgi:serine O-acetyltransferase
VPPGATAVGNPARMIDRTEQSRQREEQAEKMGFSAYAVGRDQDDPLAKAIHGCSITRPKPTAVWPHWSRKLDAQGVKCDQESRAGDSFDPKYLSKIVD